MAMKMNMDKEGVGGFLAEILDGLAVAEYARLPEIGLYMDQLTTVIDERLRGYKRSEVGKKPVLTKTMINNYTKDGVLPPPERKKYGREQIALLVLIYHLKSVITIQDISAIFDVIEDGMMTVESVYKAFEVIQGEKVKSLRDNIGGIVEEVRGVMNLHPGLAGKSEALPLLTAISLLTEASLLKLLAERLIDSFKEV